MKTTLTEPSAQPAHQRDRAASGPAPIPIVHIITKLELGGAQQNTLYTVSHLDRRRFAPYLVAGCGGIMDDDARQLGDVTVSWVRSLIREIRPWRDLRAFIELWRQLRRIRRSAGPAMLVHTHSSKAGILGRWAARLAGATVIVHTYHGFGFHSGQPGWLRRSLIGIERLTATVTDAVIVVSRANQRQGAAIGLFQPSAAREAGRRPPSLLIRSGIAFAQFRAERSDEAAETRGGGLRATLRIPNDAPVVITVACLKPQKAPLDLVDVAQRVRRQLPEVRFLVIGDGELRPAMETAIESAGLRDCVLLLGWRRDVPALLQAADLFALTSRWEGLPRSILEAMLAGLPVVATAVDGVTDVVQEGVNGFVVKVGELERMAQRVVEVLTTPALRRQMGRSARALSEEFDIDRMVRQQEALYQQLLRAKEVIVQ